MATTGFIWPSGFRGEDFFKSANQKQELPMAAMFVNGSGQNEQSLERTSIDASYQAFGITWRPSFVVCHLLTFHILIFSSETHQSNELKLSRKHLWKVHSKECTFCYDPLPNMPVVAMFVNRSGRNEQSS
jgi:hypothetical protein